MRPDLQLDFQTNSIFTGDDIAGIVELVHANRDELLKLYGKKPRADCHTKPMRQLGDVFGLCGMGLEMLTKRRGGTLATYRIDPRSLTTLR